MLDNKWMPPQEKITEVRQALLNPVSAHQFRQFVSVKGNLLENNILFWLEVQRYKVGVSSVYVAMLVVFYGDGVT